MLESDNNTDCGRHLESHALPKIAVRTTFEIEGVQNIGDSRYHRLDKSIET
jgi:hypothetical protein